MKKPLDQYTIEELKKSEQKMKFLTGLMFGLIFVMIIAEGYQWYNSKVFELRMLLPIAFLGVLVSNYGQLKKYREELNRRGAS